MSKRKIIKMVSIIVIITSVVGVYLYKINRKENTESYISEGIPVVVTSLEKGNISEYIKFFGSIKAGEEESIKPIVSAKVTSVNVKEGDYVEKGDILMTLDSTEVDKQIEDIQKFYNASLKMANESKNKVASLEESVKKLEKELNEYDKEYKKIENYNKEINKNLNELDKEYKNGEITKEEFFEKQQELNAELNKNNNTLGKISKEILSKRLSKKTLEEALEKFKDSNIDSNSNVSLDKMYDNLIKLKEEYIVKAPINGYVKDNNVEVLDSGLNPFMQAMTIYNMSSVSFDILIQESGIKDFKIGNKVKVEIDTKDGVVKETGEVKYISTKKDKLTNQYTVTINLNNKNNKIEINNYAKAFISKNNKKDIFIISKNALLRENGESYVYIVRDGIVHQRKVVLGAEDDDNVEIIEGLSKDEEVILKGKEFVKEGDKVIVVKGEI